MHLMARSGSALGVDEEKAICHDEGSDRENVKRGGALLVYDYRMAQLDVYYGTHMGGS